MFSIRYNMHSNELLDISDEILPDLADEITNVKVFEGDKPNVLSHTWDKYSLLFEPREPTPIYEVSKITFRRRFTFEQQIAVDEFNETYMDLPYLTLDQKRMIRTGLNNYNETPEINLKDPFIPVLLGVYKMVGILNDLDIERIMEVTYG